MPSQWNDGDYPQSLKDTLGDILPTLTQDEKDLIKGSCDFFAIDPYTSYYAFGIDDFDACVSNSSISFSRDAATSALSCTSASFSFKDWRKASSSCAVCFCVAVAAVQSRWTCSHSVLSLNAPNSVATDSPTIASEVNMGDGDEVIAGWAGALGQGVWGASHSNAGSRTRRAGAFGYRWCGSGAVKSSYAMRRKRVRGWNRNCEHHRALAAWDRPLPRHARASARRHAQTRFALMEEPITPRMCSRRWMNSRR